MKRRTLLKGSLPILWAGMNNSAIAAPPKFSRTRLRKNVVLVTVDLGLFEENFRKGKNKCNYFSRFFKDFKGDVTYFNKLSQPGLNGGHKAEHATFTTLRYTDRDLHPNRPFISLDQHLAEYSKQETRHKFIYHKVTGGGGNVSFNSLAQPTPSYNGLAKLHNELFGHVDLGKLKQSLSKQRFILNELLSNTKRRMRGSPEEKDMVASIAYKIDELDERVKWFKVPKPRSGIRFKKSEIEKSPLKYADQNFTTIFEAIDKEQTKIALVQFGGGSMTKGIKGITHGYHALSHHGYDYQRVSQLTSIDDHVLRSLQQFLQQLKESNILKDTVVLFTCAMADANRHTNKNVPAFLFGGGFKHKECIECKDSSGKQAITTSQLFSTVLKQAGFNDPSFSGNKKVIDQIL